MIDVVATNMRKFDNVNPLLRNVVKWSDTLYDIAK